MKSALDKRIVYLGGLLAPLVTLVVSPWNSYDPINLVKVLALSTLSFSLAGLLIGYQKTIRSRFTSLEWIVLLSFPIALFIPFFFADSNKSQQFWGVFGRSTGFLAYFSLWLFLLSIASVRSANVGKRIQTSLLITAVPMTIYALIQSAKLDPISWSSKNVFGTLGNINFLSAFFGLSCLAGIVFIFSKTNSFYLRISVAVMVFVDLVLAYRTDSIQGPLIFLIGTATYLGYFLRRSTRFSMAFYPYIVLSTVVSLLGIAGLLNYGPLRSILFQVTNVYRADYMLAAIRMTQQHPLTGVGLDSYDNWFRAVRGFITTYRTGWNRTSNSAHNILLDISSGGGFPLLLSYLAILFLALRAGLQLLKKSRGLDSSVIGAFILWLAYQAQSIISINQIGIGVWGWAFSGVLISMNKTYGANLETDESSGPQKKGLKTSKRVQPQQVKASAAIASLLVGGIGFVLAYLPFSADAAFRTAADKRDLTLMIAASERPGASSLHLARALEAAFQNKYYDKATELSERLTKNYPSDTYGWQIRTGLSTLTPEQRTEAKNQINKWDPFFACLEADPIATIRGWYNALPAEKRWELVRWWGFASQEQFDPAELAAIEAGAKFAERLNGQCGGA